MQGPPYPASIHPPPILLIFCCTPDGSGVDESEVDESVVDDSRGGSIEGHIPIWNIISLENA